MTESKTNADVAVNECKIVTEIHEMFGRYGPTFVDLAIGKRSDMNALLDFYGAPLRFIGPTFHVVMQDDSAITGPDGMGGEIDRLRQGEFRGAAAGKVHCNLVHDP